MTMPNDKQSRAELVEELRDLAGCFETARSSSYSPVAEAFQRNANADARDLIPQAASAIEADQARIEALEAENARLLRTATDRRYMLEAYRAMLGPKGLEVVASWNASNVQRVHYDWTQDALTLTGEERAQIILDWEEARKSAVLIDDVDSHLSARSALNPEREEK